MKKGSHLWLKYQKTLVLIYLSGLYSSRDHAGGNTQLKESMESLEVYGGDSRVDAVTKIVQDGNSFNIGTLKVKCLFTPCHTTGHICYFVSADSGPPAVFTGMYPESHYRLFLFYNPMFQ